MALALALGLLFGAGPAAAPAGAAEASESVTASPAEHHEGEEPALHTEPPALGGEEAPPIVRSPGEAHTLEGHEAQATESHGTEGHGLQPGEAGHGAGHAEEPTVMEEAIHAAEHVSLIDLILSRMGYELPHEGQPDNNSPALKTLAMFQLPIYSLLVILLLGFTAAAAASRREMVPGPLQNFVEVIVSGLADFVEGILGLEGRPFVPYIGTLFLYIWISNLIGILPFFKAPTSSINTTLALALCTFLYVQYTALRGQGPLGYLFHLAGEPRDGIGWAMVPLMLPLHIIGEFAKPLSLSLRLFGNIFGEETLVAVFVGMGVAILAATHLPIGLPIQTPFYFLALLTSTIQALVFSLLTTIYISLVLPHKHHEAHDEHGGASHHGAGEGHADAPGHGPPAAATH